MRRVATGLLVLMAALFFLARYGLGVHPFFSYLKAFAEAGMVGGMADWFAVTALFRHPLGLPIPHTAIIPRNKDRIGDALAQFLQTNFLTPSVIARRLQSVDLAGTVGRFMADPDPGGSGRLREGASRLLADVLDSLDDQRLGGMVKSAIGDRLRALNIAPMMGQALEAAMAEGRHLPLIDAMLIRAAHLLEENEPLVRDMVHERSGRVLRWTGLDENVANAIIDGLNKLLADMAEDADHPIRERLNTILHDVASKMRTDATMQERVDEIKVQLIENAAMQDWIGGLWDQGRAALLRAARDPDQAMAGRFGETVRQLGNTLEADPELRTTINRFARRAAVGGAASYGDGIVRLVSDTIRSWDTAKVTNRIENAVGSDLQFIRINGTLVGGLVGLIIHAVDQLV